ncbi:MAG: PAS domain-containing protein [Deltaproteobacteria bacterium]|nr:PAS domain-containing protein [Deltaproteobacteria bacterium]
MTDPPTATEKPRPRSLRRRVLATFLGLALAPLAAAVAGFALLARLQGGPRALSYPAAADSALLLACVAVAATLLACSLANRYLAPILRLRKGAEIILRINPGHRLDVSTGDELEELATDFNRMAASLETAYADLGRQVEQTTADLQEERNRLAAVLRTMTEGVVVTNAAGEVLLMNPRARLVLGSGPASGIGAPLARLLPSARTEFHLKRVRARRDAEEEVVFPLPAGRVLSGALSAIGGRGGAEAGFLLVFRDVSARAEEGEKAKTALRELPELIKGPAANLHSLAEALERRSDMPAEKQKAFLGALREEAKRLVERLKTAEDAAATAGSHRWPSHPADPRELLEEAAASAQGAFVRVEAPQEPLPPVLLEPFSWVSALSAVLRWVGERSSGWEPVEVRLSVEEESVVTTFRTNAAGVPSDELDRLPVPAAGEESLTIGEIVRRNRGELWSRKSDGVVEVRLAALVASARPSRPAEGGRVDEQPEFYDFDLFIPKPSAEAGERLARRLSDLDYVAFDAETTGLAPSSGDEIVSLSAVRIRGGKLQGGGGFHALVNPGRPIPPASTAFHGIADEAVRGAPPLAEVLPQFRQYVGDAVLVAHNAAFDKKFLDLAAKKLRMPALENPILDTLFLSYGLHSDFKGHNLEAIAERLGVSVVGRHTSQGDARATAEIFLRLVQLLESRGIRTLAEAQGFCDRMLLLRWQVSRF